MNWFWQSKNKNTFQPKIGDFITNRHYNNGSHTHAIYVKSISDISYWGEEFVYSEEYGIHHMGSDSLPIGVECYPSSFPEEQRQFIIDYLDWCKTATVPANVYHFKRHLEGRTDWTLIINDKFHFIGTDETKAKEIEQQLITAINNREIIVINDTNICGGGVVSFKLESTVY